MLYSLPSPLRTVLGLSAVVLNTLFWTAPMFVVTLVKLMTRDASKRVAQSELIAEFAQRWIGVNCWLIDHFQRVHWEFSGLEGLSTKQWYLIVSNHCSGLDIPVLQKVFHRRIPFIRFFLKKNLIWVPILGQAWWALDYPFMKRHSAEAVAKDPTLRLQDLEETGRACAKFSRMPTSILNFVEGTRFTPEKHDAQDSTYVNLLKPKVGGLAHAIEAMGSRFTSLLDVTLFYPDGDVDMWELARGRVRRIVVHVEQRPIPLELLEGDYIADKATRERFHAWLNDMWAEKDALIEGLKEAEMRKALVPAPSV